MVQKGPVETGKGGGGKGVWWHGNGERGTSERAAYMCFGKHFVSGGDRPVRERGTLFFGDPVSEALALVDRANCCNGRMNSIGGGQVSTTVTRPYKIAGNRDTCYVPFGENDSHVTPTPLRITVDSGLKPGAVMRERYEPSRSGIPIEPANSPAHSLPCQRRMSAGGGGYSCMSRGRYVTLGFQQGQPSR